MLLMILIWKNEVENLCGREVETLFYLWNEIEMWWKNEHNVICIKEQYRFKVKRMMITRWLMMNSIGVNDDDLNVDNRFDLNMYSARIIINISRNEENFKMFK
jgi:hypothetical protein